MVSGTPCSYEAAGTVWRRHLGGIYTSTSHFLQCLSSNLFCVLSYNINPGETEIVKGLAYLGSALILMETAAEKPGEG